MKNIILFAMGCLLANGIMDYLALSFLLCTQGPVIAMQNNTTGMYTNHPGHICRPLPRRREMRIPVARTAKGTGSPLPLWQYTALWLALGGFLALLAIRFQFPGLLPVHMLLLLLFAKTILKMALADIAAPIAILFTLYTLTEGFSALAMSWMSINLTLTFPGAWLQLPLSLALALLFSLALRLIRKNCAPALRRPFSSCLYLLLLPCAVLVLMIRYSLRLDSLFFEEYLRSFNINATLTALFGMAAAAVLFILILNVFCRISRLTEQEQAAALLAGQLKGQQIYMEEARKRNEQYTSFRHDLDNHLLVLCGLLDEQNYKEAQSYAQKLRKKGLPLSVPVTTGCAALDILLNEKLSHARRNGIQAACQVQIPAYSLIDEMDLCIIFSNILDNAINACRDSESAIKTLSIATKIRSRFLLIESANTAPPRQTLKPGTGLRNIRGTAEKYQGTVEITYSGNRFCIRVLLCPAAG